VSDLDDEMLSDVTSPRQPMIASAPVTSSSTSSAGQFTASQHIPTNMTNGNIIKQSLKYKSLYVISVGHKSIKKITLYIR